MSKLVQFYEQHLYADLSGLLDEESLKTYRITVRRSRTGANLYLVPFNDDEIDLARPAFYLILDTMQGFDTRRIDRIHWVDEKLRSLLRRDDA